MKKSIFILLFVQNLFSQGIGYGTRIDLTQPLNLSSGQFAQLFIPDYYSPLPNGEYTLVFHFHSASWAAENELYKTGANAVLFNIHLGALSSPYQNYFTDQSKFQRILDTVNQRLINNGIILNAVLDKIIITSFSAGYAGVREVLKNQVYYNRITALTLADGLHSSSDPSSMHAQMKDFVRFAKDARDRIKIFILTHSSITTSGYQSTTQTANYLIDSIGSVRIPFSAVDEIGSQYSKSDTGNFRLKGYYGNTADDHLKHLYGMHLMLGKVVQILSGVVSADQNDIIPSESSLHQNYPNPFNPVTTIRFDLAERKNVNIKIFGITGETVADLLNEERAAGTYDLVFDASSLPSGFYICRMSAGKEISFRKMIVLK
jgi:hypothetical protein